MLAFGRGLGRLIEAIRDWRNAKAEWRRQKDLAAHYAEEARRQAEHSSELGRLAAEWERQQNHYPEHEPAQAELERIKQKNRLRENFERSRNVIRWPK